MTDAVLIFTFGPVQSYITQARRTSDLYAGSQTLVALARAAAGAIQRCGRLVYPASVSTSSARDVPNKLVALVRWAEAAEVANQARLALAEEWRHQAEDARASFWCELGPSGLSSDGVWEQIWVRQTSMPWETHWACASLNGRSYAEAYREGSRVLDATKRTRAFEAVEEPGQKDSLSGQREALHSGAMDAKEYWMAASRATTAALLRPLGRELLDALGLVKRFGRLGRSARFLSTSSVASIEFLERARPHLRDYRSTVEWLLGAHLYRVRDDRDWPYDGDLLYLDTLAPGRLRDSYGLSDPDLEVLDLARGCLRDVYDRVGGGPSPYYAIVVLDGDNMGKRLDEALEKPQPLSAHQELSAALSRFSEQVPSAVRDSNGMLVYNGGDDVLLLAPLARAVPLARNLSECFQTTTGGSASAGLAVAHHLYPLGAALRAARAAEGQAKQMPGKAAIGLRVLRRSGEHAELRSPWAPVGECFDELVDLFRDERGHQPLASGFAYDAAAATSSLPEPGERFRAELRRLLERHRDERHTRAPDAAFWAERLCAWAQRLGEPSDASPTDVLARWIVFARFVAQGGGRA